MVGNGDQFHVFRQHILFQVLNKDIRFIAESPQIYNHSVEIGLRADVKYTLGFGGFNHFEFLLL